MPIINNINELNERITIIEMSADDGPDPSETERDLFSCWAKIRTQTIKDVKAAYGTRFDNTIEVVIRQIQAYKIDNTMKVRFKNEIYNIVTVNNDFSYKEFMVLVLKKPG